MRNTASTSRMRTGRRWPGETRGPRPAIRRSLKEFGYDWADEAFTADERKICEREPDPALLFARGLCGKEACFKALGTGRTADIDWHDIVVLQSGPSVTLNLSGGGASDELQRITPAGHERNCYRPRESIALIHAMIPFVQNGHQRP
jgi:phosphopantetheinyl transferase (holo-ACP synthase)